MTIRMKALKAYMCRNKIAPRLRGGKTGEAFMPLKGSHLRSAYSGFGKIPSSNTSVQKDVQKENTT